MTGQPEADELRIRSILQRRGVGPDAHETAARPADPTPGADPDGWWDDLYSEQPEEREPERQPAPRLPPWWSQKPTDLTHEADEESTEDEPEAAEAAESDDEPDEEPAEGEPEAKPAAPAKKVTPTPKSGRKKKQEKAEKPRPGAPRTAWDTRPASPRQSLLDAWGQVPPRLKWLMYHATAAYMGWEIGLVDYATYVTAWIAATGRIGAQAFFWYGVGAATYLLYRRSRAWGPAAWLAAVPLCSTITGVLLHGYVEYHP